MAKGGVSLNGDSEKAIRYIALFATPFFAGYNILVMAGIAPSSNYINVPFTIAISVLWVAVALYHFFVPVHSRFDMLLRLVAYHALALTSVALIGGFSQPFAPSLALLFLAANTYFGRIGFSLSILSVIVVAAIDAWVRVATYPEIVGQNVLGVLGILILGGALVGILSSQEIRRKSLLHSQNQERLQYDRVITIINNLTDATFSTDEKGRILMYNAACLDLLDTNASLKGKDIGELFNLTVADKDKTKANLLDIMTQATRTTRRDDLIHTYADGEEIRIEITYAPIRSSYSRRKKAEYLGGYILILRDVTKQKSLEEERDEFISVVSHELRTPITVVEGTLSNLEVLSQRATLDKKTLSTSISDAHNEILYLARMINDLSTLSRAERGVGDQPEEIDVATLMKSLHQQYEKDATDKKLHLDVDISPKPGSVYISRLYLEELMQNFITNAIKYTQKGTVTLIAEKKGKQVTFAVKDTGIGMSRGDQTKIFNKFYRSEDYRIRETSGTGLGLYVSAKLAQKMKTKISLTSRLNHGSTFSFDLPVYKGPNA